MYATKSQASAFQKVLEVPWQATILFRHMCLLAEKHNYSKYIS